MGLLMMRPVLPLILLGSNMETWFQAVIALCIVVIASSCYDVARSFREMAQTMQEGNDMMEDQMNMPDDGDEWKNGDLEQV